MDEMERGRPTKYTPELCAELDEYFDRQPTTADGEAVDYPTIAGFAAQIGVDTDTIVRWSKKYPDFYAAYNRAKTRQEHILLVNGLAGRYNSNFARFVAINIFDGKYKDKQDINANVDTSITFKAGISGKDLKDIIS